jgi:XTP/dITP diphosphohydrolase
MDLLIATKNPGKFGEISKFLKISGVKLFSLHDFPKVEDPEESGRTFKENALIKAKYYAEKFKMAALADDGGLEIKVFNGEPGVKSRRWLDGVHEATDEELIDYCLKKMKSVKNRKAKLTACLCVYCIGGRKIFAQESIAGVIAEKPAKNVFSGFPFRSLLWIPKLKKFYNEDEFTESETKKYNHRYRAVGRIKNELKKYL